MTNNEINDLLAFVAEKEELYRFDKADDWADIACEIAEFNSKSDYY